MLLARTKNGWYSLTRLCVLQLVMVDPWWALSTLTEERVWEQLTGVLFSPSSTTLGLLANKRYTLGRQIGWFQSQL